jgi:tagatose 6-phosphate kinase
VILAAGLTPALQQMLVFDGLRVGEVNRAREATWCSSGKVLNVGLALHHLGGDNLTLALLGGSPGERISREIDGLGMRHRWIWSAQPTRVCTTILDVKSGLTTELVENAASPSPAEIEEFAGVFEAEAERARMVVLCGSLPAGVPRTFYRDLMKRTRSRVILDARGPELLEALPLRPFCVKPNREELGKTFGRELKTDADLGAAMEEAHRLGAEWVIVSDGKKALWASGEGTLCVFHPPRVDTVNPIGCGDCLAAGIAWAVDTGMDVLQAVRFGMAAAAENAAMMLPARLDLERVRRRMAGVTAGQS